MNNDRGHLNRNWKPFNTVIIIVLNVVLICGVIISVVTALNNEKNTSFQQNIENIKTLTDASANKVELEIEHHKREVVYLADYISGYNDVGMTLSEIISFFQLYYGNGVGENAGWQLVKSRTNQSAGTSLGFDAIALGGENIEKFSYKVQVYSELSEIFAIASADNLGKVNFTSEFTDASSLLCKSFATTTTVKVRDDGSDTYEYWTLMLLIRSSYIDDLISNNNYIDTLSYFDYSNVIIDDEGDYVISNQYFQGTNFCDYIKLYNDDFSEDTRETILTSLQGEDYTDIFFYNDNKDVACAYTIVPIQNSNWHILSMVPLHSFRSSSTTNRNFAIFGVLFAILFMVDISFFIMINAQLRASNRAAKAANKAKSQFLSSMSHDIRTPMNAIVGMTIVADDNLKQENVDLNSIRECINTIRLSGKHLLTLINDVLDISKIENGKIVITPEDFSVANNIQKLIEIIQPEMKKKNLEFHTNTDSIEHKYVCADALRINQIYLNILSNAVKYTNSGGSVTLTLKEEIIEGDSHKARYIYEVTDTGIGMDEDFVKIMFDSFSRAEDHRVNTTQGTGLGMAIAKQLIDLMGGTITVQSRINVGTTITVALDLPILNVQTEEKLYKLQQDNEATTEQLGKLKVLVAEDNDINWMVINRILKMYNINPDRAENGKVCIDKIQDSAMPYDIVFMDIQMPVMNGYEATKYIRRMSEKEKSQIPIYAMTADAFAEDIAKCRQVGMNGHIAKPFELDKLIGVLTEVYNNKNF